MKKILLLLLLPSLFQVSCKRTDDGLELERSKSEEKLIVQEVRLSPPVGAGDADAANGSKNRYIPNERKIIKTGEISFESDNIVETRKNIGNLVQKYEAYISSDNQSGYEGDKKEYSLVIKVPAANFDKLLNAITIGAGKIISKNIRVEDISSQYIDQETRIKNMRQLEGRYLQLLAKATQIGDMLKIENKLSELRTEIESATRQFMLLQQQVAYSTLTITYYSKAVNAERHISFVSLLKTSFSQGLDHLVTIFLVLISAWPLLFIVFLIYMIIYGIRKRRQADKKRNINESLSRPTV